MGIRLRVKMGGGGEGGGEYAKGEEGGRRGEGVRAEEETH